MRFSFTSTMLVLGVVGLLSATGCAASDPEAVGRAEQAASDNGAAGQMPAYYDGNLLTVNMKEMPKNASASLIANSKSINEIYATNDLDEEQDFIPVNRRDSGRWIQSVVETEPHRCQFRVSTSSVLLLTRRSWQLPRGPTPKSRST
jgi:hypothetical protein